MEGKKHGFGVFKWKDGNSYEGNFHKGEINGKGKYNWLNIKFLKFLV